MALSSSFSQEVKTNREAITIKEVLNIFFISESNYVKVDFDQVSISAELRVVNCECIFLIEAV